MPDQEAKPNTAPAILQAEVDRLICPRCGKPKEKNDLWCDACERADREWEARQGNHR
jgi:hypothetical protein